MYPPPLDCNCVTSTIAVALEPSESVKVITEDPAGVVNEDGIDDDVKSKFIASMSPAAFKILLVVYAKTTLSQPVGQQFVCIDEIAL